MADGEITISELELSEELLADMVIPVETSTDTKSATLQQLKSWLGTSLPIGSFFSSVGKIDDPRFTLLDGKTLSATGTYAEFYLKAVEKVQAGKWQSCTEEEFNQEVAQYGQCLKFVISNDYVRIPKVGNKFYSSSFNSADVAVVGNGKTLGLTDGTTKYASFSTGGSDVFRISTKNYGSNVGTTGSSDAFLLSNATIGITDEPSNSGIIAKTSNLNFNNTTNIYYYMVVSTEGQTESVDIDINQVYEDINLKADATLSNVVSVSQAFKNASVGWGMPDYNSGISVPSLPYTATMNGFIFIIQRNDAFITVNGSNVAYNGQSVATTNTQDIGFLIPVSKNDVISSTIISKTSYMVFYPAKGV